ncbi:MAG: hypothetical protein U5L45_07090 [Saprospiraceae bacterium]|nr:hypothetical protein [Saprospiraceae bacterium]
MFARVRECGSFFGLWRKNEPPFLFFVSEVSLAKYLHIFQN